ncbi:11208_t:CDS:2 [Funneliformis mosseae]|uniref:11208_t:CDS:1 n=1 Tax=Funneliformis mosseae TaxID=27381 RepID=A0A9N9EG29_FUNMO|nr:11208_t:CDS:2 [Funneliformis mosseae]
MEQESGYSYFTEIEPSEWSLIGFLEWKSKTTHLIYRSKKHSAFKSFLQNIAKDKKKTPMHKGRRCYSTTGNVIAESSNVESLSLLQSVNHTCNIQFYCVITESSNVESLSLLQSVSSNRDVFCIIDNLEMSKQNAEEDNINQFFNSPSAKGLIHFIKKLSKIYNKKNKKSKAKYKSQDPIISAINAVLDSSSPEDDYTIDSDYFSPEDDNITDSVSANISKKHYLIFQ